jgi:ribosomal protein S18 acetylase RimI-like enzyme
MSGGAVRVRRATTADVPALVALMGEFYAESGFPLPVAEATGTFNRLLSAPHLGAAWLMTAGDVPAGFAVLTTAFSMEYGGLRGFVDDLFVAPQYRRQGFASAALDAVKRASTELGVRALLVETSLANDAAVRVYRRAGFVENGRLLLTMPLASAVHEADDRS